jgi:hypothetical protein
MSPTSPLNEIWQNYQLATDCFKITRRTLVKGDTGLLSNTGFAAASLEDADRIIVKGRNEWDDFVILSLWAIKYYRDWIVHKSKMPAANVTPIQAYNVLHRIVSTISAL